MFNGVIYISFNPAYSIGDISDLKHDITLSIKTVLQLTNASLKYSAKGYSVHYRIGLLLLPENLYNLSKILDGLAGFFQSLTEVDQCRFVLES